MGRRNPNQLTVKPVYRGDGSTLESRLLAVADVVVSILAKATAKDATPKDAQCAAAAGDDEAPAEPVRWPGGQL
ncbi:hypothetical protein [Alicyclobacillus acidoterrestris]|uniref:hypothetical protein n=1 Tax=Alicyclobacillus acidoterrestris TaxID=1450 RepID=UPI0003867CCD|nr:hypothetical protein [Alicyclobacillus acidoterrestris]EPZ50881.1 hypothetical protein N007_21055 [Alicyclobacillus acidoterrestris ATCC 49025]